MGRPIQSNFFLLSAHCQLACKWNVKYCRVQSSKCSEPDKICYILNFEKYTCECNSLLNGFFFLFFSFFYFFCCRWTTGFIFSVPDICTYFKVSECLHIVIVSKEQNFHMYSWLFLVCFRQNSLRSILVLSKIFYPKNLYKGNIVKDGNDDYNQNQTILYQKYYRFIILICTLSLV